MKIKTVVIFVVVITEGGTREFSVVLEMATSQSEGFHFIQSQFGWTLMICVCGYVCCTVIKSV